MSGEVGGAGGDRGAGQSTRIGERLDGDGAQIKQRARIDVDADALRSLGAVELADWRAPRAPLARALRDLGEPGTPDRTVQRAVADELAVDPVLFDQGVDFRRAAAEQGEQPLAIVRA